MAQRLSNVHSDAREAVAKNAAASELALALQGSFSITATRDLRKFQANYTSLFCKPTKAVSASLLVDREVLALIAPYKDIHARTITVAREIIAGHSPQLHPSIALVVHADPNGDTKLRAWGREHGMTLLPIYRPKAGTVPSPAALRQGLARELFAADPFQVTGPVADDVDFFGRRNEALELLRQLEKGRIRALFGVRKVGKTSLLNRIIGLARKAGTPRIAMIDCSLRSFNSLDAAAALRAVGKVCKMAATQGYAHISDALRKSDKELVPLFSDLWEQKELNHWPLVIAFDEIDFITPDSPSAPHWNTEFNEFWREFRVLIQEAHRHEMGIAVLVSGVSSRCFRMEQIAGVENSALHFVPDEYLSSFDRGASDSMLRELGRRCGLHFDDGARALIADACADFPFWIRMACSHIHRAIDIDSRPLDVPATTVSPLLDQFIATEGLEIAKVALTHFSRVYPELFSTLEECGTTGSVTAARGRLLVRYGLGVERAGRVSVRGRLIASALAEHAEAPPASTPAATARGSLALSESEWAEELAIINRRRNILERRMRDLVHFTLKAKLPKTETWIERVLKALPEERRKALVTFAPQNVLERLYWKELGQILGRDWELFSHVLGDKKRFQLAMELLNDRPDTHAKAVDLADIALQRRELQWLEDAVGS